VANKTTKAPLNARRRRTEGSGSSRFSTLCTTSTIHTVADKAGANPNRAPGCPDPYPETSSSKVHAWASHPNASAASGQRDRTATGHVAAV